MDGKESEESMRIPELDFDMDIEGLVTVSQDGDIELLPCPLTELITAETRLSFERFYICISEFDDVDTLLCAYSAFSEMHYVLFDILLSEPELAMIRAL